MSGAQGRVVPRLVWALQVYGYGGGGGRGVILLLLALVHPVLYWKICLVAVGTNIISDTFSYPLPLPVRALAAV